MNTLLLAAATKRSTDLPDLEYFGTEPLVNGTALANQSGITHGNATNSTAGFLKFARKGKLIYVASRPFRSSISWDYLNARNLIKGNRTVTIDGKVYVVRLLTGGNGDPSTGAGGEWNELMYAVCSDRPADYTGPVLANLHPNTLGIGNGAMTMCQETWASNSERCVCRGQNNVADYSGYLKTFQSTTVYWRPVLEPVE